MKMLAFDPIRAKSHDFLRISQYFTIPPKLYIKSEAVVRLDTEQRRDLKDYEQHHSKEIDKLGPRRGGTLKESYYS